MIYLILLLYIGFTFWGSLIGAGPQGRDPETYFLANRNLKTLSLFFTILATNFSAFYFLGFAGEAYRIGYTHYTIMALGTGLASISFYLIGSKVWRLGQQKGYITPAELIYDQSGSRWLSYLYGGVMILFTLPYLSLQIVGGGYLLESITNGQIPYTIAVFLLTLFTIAYVLIGGMQSVARTDLKQGILMILFMLIATVLISYQLGGLGEANRAVFTLQPELFRIEGKGAAYPPQRWFSIMLIWMFCVPMFPQLFMRFYIAKDERHLMKSTFLYAAIPIIISLFPVIIGVLGHLSFPDLQGKAADQILPMMLLEHSHEWFAALVMVGAIAAFMSTLDSQLLALGTIITRDFYIPISGHQPSFEQEVRIGRIGVIFFALIGLLIALRPFDTIFDMGKLAFAGLAILFPLSLAIVRWGGVRPAFGIASIVIGEVLLLAFYYDWLPKAWLLGFEAYLPILLLGFVLVWMGRPSSVKKT
ncbi:MAG: sodium:solute symporter family protein [Bacteroidota bacterium]